LSFLYSDTVDKGSIPDAYSRILYDCFIGDQTLFVSTKEIQAEWKYVSEIGKQWEKNTLWKYEQGTPGPEERKRFFEGDFID
jgi:glucose-6-phosphate 1-dehydrogenase